MRTVRLPVQLVAQYPPDLSIRNAKLFGGLSDVCIPIGLEERLHIGDLFIRWRLSSDQVVLQAGLHKFRLAPSHQSLELAEMGNESWAFREELQTE